MSLADLQGLAERSDLEQIEAGAEQQVGELDRFLLQLILRQRGDGPGGGNGGGGHFQIGFV